jgi:hypothetical protein
MEKIQRRSFLGNMGAGLGLITLGSEDAFVQTQGPLTASSRAIALALSNAGTVSIDFRYSPANRQATFCFPDDPYKSLVGEDGELRYGFSRDGASINDFQEVVDFSLAGMEADKVIGQKLEAPGIPIIYTRIERPAAFLHLTTFATNRESEGRVDNVIIEILPRSQDSILAVPIVVVRTKKELVVDKHGNTGALRLGGRDGSLFLLVNSSLSQSFQSGISHFFALEQCQADPAKPLRYFVRLPQEGQSLEKILAGLSQGDDLLKQAQAYWTNWKPSKAPVSVSLPKTFDDFFVASARNIQQAREIKNGKMTFQVGPTCYRGLWIVDGHFILEAARYLGYDLEAQQGLETTWEKQENDGGIFAGGGREHWKDTGIALFTLVRQAELAQDWSYFRQMQPNVLRSISFLKKLRDTARSEGNGNGRYGLLARGFGDGGMGGVRSEFTNTLWVLAGLHAVTESAERLNLSGFEDAKRFYGELRTALFAAARQEMRLHPAGFEYLPMLMKEDPDWNSPDPWIRPKPQMAQWALSQAIYPGLVFERNDPIVNGHVALMQACTKEDVPIETGWLPHEGVWNYNAAFVAHVYLWAGVYDWARQTFIGFLNHATPLYCWREEQPLQGTLVAEYIGDMPHNWASAQCVLFLRHMLALEDGHSLRLLEGISDAELISGEAFSLVSSPTRFGRVNLNLEPLGLKKGWQATFKRETGPNPGSLEVPFKLGSALQLTKVNGASMTPKGDHVSITPAASSWTATWS